MQRVIQQLEARNMQDCHLADQLQVHKQPVVMTVMTTTCLHRMWVQRKKRTVPEYLVFVRALLFHSATAHAFWHNTDLISEGGNLLVGVIHFHWLGH
jgi:hypothetical protein